MRETNAAELCQRGIFSSDARTRDWVAGEFSIDNPSQNNPSMSTAPQFGDLPTRAAQFIAVEERCEIESGFQNEKRRWVESNRYGFAVYEQAFPMGDPEKILDADAKDVADAIVKFLGDGSSIVQALSPGKTMIESRWPHVVLSIGLIRSKETLRELTVMIAAGFTLADGTATNGFCFAIQDETVNGNWWVESVPTTPLLQALEEGGCLFEAAFAAKPATMLSLAKYAADADRLVEAMDLYAGVLAPNMKSAKQKAL